MLIEAGNQRSVMSLARDVGVIILGTLLLAISAKVVVPFYPVPMTTQTLVVLCLGLFLGPVRAGATVVVYLFEGLMGLPVFAGTPPAVAGPAYLLGPTGGYLIGFLLCAVVSGFVAQRLSGTRPVSGAFLAVLSGSIAIYMPGLAWLGSFLGYDEKLLAAGLYPFVSGDVTKAAIACVLFMIFRDSHVMRRIR